jgi:hypothetical protein
MSIFNTVKLRVLENVLKSSRLFPVEYSKIVEATIVRPPSCEKYPRGTTLDLTSAAFVIFSGRVQVEPPGSGPLIFAAAGEIGAVPVIGIVSGKVMPDGATATILEETVAVKIDHEVLRELQKIAQVKRAWDALYGQRLGEIENAQPSESKPVAVAT